MDILALAYQHPNLASLGIVSVTVLAFIVVARIVLGRADGQ
jgi:hypothetical protein